MDKTQPHPLFKLATELGPYDIRVNAVCPGLVAGPRIEAVLARQAAARGITEEEVRAEADTTVDKVVEALRTRAEE